MPAPPPIVYIGHEVLTWTGGGGSIDVPAGTETGDLLVLVVHSNWIYGDFDTPIIGPGWSLPPLAYADDLSAGSHVVTDGDPASYDITMGPFTFDVVGHDEPGGVAVLMAWRGIEVFTNNLAWEDFTDPAPASMATTTRSGLPERRVLLAIYGMISLAQWFSTEAGENLDTINQPGGWGTAVDPLGNFTFTELVDAPHGLSIQVSGPSEGAPYEVGAVEAERLGEFGFVDDPPGEDVGVRHQVISMLMVLHGFEPTPDVATGWYVGGAMNAT